MLTRQERKFAQSFCQDTLNLEDLCTQEGITPETLARWLAQPEFQAELRRFIEIAAWQAQCLLARYAPTAANRLTELLDSDKPDVVRRAALDLLDRCLLPAKSPHHELPHDSSLKDLTDGQLREKLLALAESFSSNTEEPKV